MSTVASVAGPKIDRFLRLMTSRGASDFHLTVGRPPMLRVSGSMEPIRYRTLSEADFVELVRPIVPERLWEEYTGTGDIDLAYEIAGLARFRVNVFRQRGAMSLALRVIPHEVPRSACDFCPYRSNAEWRHLQDTDPTGWAKPVDWTRPCGG